MSKEEATAAGGRGGESYHPCVSREAAMDACDNDFASKRRRDAGAAGVSQRRQRRKGGNAAQVERPATPTHRHRRRKQHHDTAPSYHYRYPEPFPMTAGCLNAWDGHNSVKIFF